MLIDFMPDSNEVLRNWREAKKLKQREAADLLGLSRAYYANLEYGQSIPDRVMDQLKKLGYGDQSSNEMKRVSLLFGDMAPIPIAGNVSAGDGNTNVDVDEQSIWVPMSLQKLGGIGYVVDGESMMPALQPGDVAVFREMHQPYARFTYLVKTEDAEYRCKNLEWRDNQWTLVSLNPNFRDEPLGSGQLLGMLIGWYRSIGKYEKLEANPDGLRLEPT